MKVLVGNPQLARHGCCAVLRAAALATSASFVFGAAVWVLEDYRSTPLLAALDDPWHALRAPPPAPPRALSARPRITLVRSRPAHCKSSAAGSCAPRSSRT